MSEQKKTLQDFLDKAKQDAPVTNAGELQSLVESHTAPGALVPKLTHRFFPKGLSMNVIGSSIASLVMIGATAVYLSHKPADSSVGSRQETVGGSRETVVGSRATVVGSRATGVGSQTSGDGNQQSITLHGSQGDAQIEIRDTAKGMTVIHRDVRLNEDGSEQKKVLIPYAGMLTQDDGSPMQGSHHLILNLYGQDTGGPSLWRETQTVILGSNGTFNIKLGEVNPLNNIPHDGPYWMSVAIDGKKEMTPRTLVPSTNIKQVRITQRIHGDAKRDSLVGETVLLAGPKGKNVEFTIDKMVSGDDGDEQDDLALPGGGVIYKARITGDGGGAITGRHQFKIALYPKGGTVVLWEQRVPIVLDANGNLEWHFGATPLLDLPKEGPYDLGIALDGQEMLPRTSIAKIPGGTQRDRALLSEQGLPQKNWGRIVLEEQWSLANNATMLTSSNIRVLDARRIGTPPVGPHVDESEYDASAYAAIVPYVDVAERSCVRSYAHNLRKSWINDSVNREREFNAKGKISTTYTFDVPNGWTFDSTAHPPQFVPPTGRRSSIAILKKENATHSNVHVEAVFDFTDVDYSKDSPVAGSAHGINISNLIELDKPSLARLGLYPDATGVWTCYLGYESLPGERNINLKHLGMNGMFIEFYGTGCNLASLPVSDIKPAAITDDLGRLRTLFYERIDSLHVDPAASGMAEDRSLMRAAELQVLKRLGTLIPIIVRTGTPFTDHDKELKRWRPDIIFWYEPTPEFLALLPTDVRNKLDHELSAVQCMISKIDVGTVSPECQQAIDDVHRTPQVVLFGNAPVDSTGSVAKATYLDLFRTATGAIMTSLVYPNPAIDKIAIQYKLSEPRTVTFSLHDIQGRRLRELAEPQIAEAGDHSANALLKNITPGMYLLAITTDKGEQAVQRLIVVDRK